MPRVTCRQGGVPRHAPGRREHRASRRSGRGAVAAAARLLRGRVQRRGRRCYRSRHCGLHRLHAHDRAHAGLGLCGGAHDNRRADGSARLVRCVLVVPAHAAWDTVQGALPTPRHETVAAPWHWRLPLGARWCAAASDTRRARSYRLRPTISHPETCCLLRDACPGITATARGCPPDHYLQSAELAVDFYLRRGFAFREYASWPLVLRELVSDRTGGGTGPLTCMLQSGALPECRRGAGGTSRGQGHVEVRVAARRNGGTVSVIPLGA